MWDKFAADLYLEFKCAKGFPNQEPAYKNAKGRDLLWFLIPIYGFLIFLEVIESRR